MSGERGDARKRLAEAEAVDPPLLALMLAAAWEQGARTASPYGGGYLRSILIENPYLDPGSA